MATSINKKNMGNVPCNFGYIKKGYKLYGKASPSGEDCVKLVELEKRHTHLWKPKVYKEWKMKHDEVDEDGWVTVEKRRKLITKIIMVPCPYEIGENGECPIRYQPEHRTHHYHFSRIQKGEVVLSDDGRPLCRWRLFGKNKCWESCSDSHKKIFAHC